jgi:VWFA-related protein
VLAAALLVLVMADTSSVRIATTVTDRQGRAVQGLTQKDFEIKEDGVVQKIDAVEARKPETRRIAILLDEFHVDAADTAAVRDALTRFVDERLRAGDSAVVLKPLDSLPAIKLTTDRDVLRRAISTFEGRKGLYEPRTPLEAETLGSAPPLVLAGRAQIVLSALRALTAQLGSESGRSAILLVTEGFAPPLPRRSDARGLPDQTMVERFANRYDVPIYAFDPRATHDESDAGSATLSKLVSETGGTLSRGPDLAASVARAATELDGGYTIVYTSAHGDDGRYHPVQVTMARREADARTRAGYIAPPSPEMRRALRGLTDRAPSAPPRMLKRSTFLQVWSGVTNLSPTGATVAVTWQPSQGMPGTIRPMAARVAVTAKTADGRLLYQGTLAPARTGAPGAADSDRAEFGAPIGRVLLDMTVIDMTGLKIDTDVRDIDIPTLKPDAPVLLPPILIATQSAREFRDAMANADAAPAPAREFRRTERLIIRVPAYAMTGAVPVTARLINRIGQLVKDLDVMPDGVTGVTQFDLNLAPLAPGDYFLQFTIAGPSGPVSQRLSFKIIG